MTSCLNLKHTVVSHNGAHIAVLFGCLCKREEAVEACNDVGVDLYLGYELSHIGDEFGEETGF